MDFGNLNFVNYHKHSMWTNTIVPDSVETIENYAKRAVELSQKVLSTVEHGWQGFFINSYEMAKKYNLKMLYGVEAYWVKDRLATYDDDGNLDDNGKKDKTNNHIVLLARNENGRRAINRILSQSAKDGFYYRTRVDVNQILSLPPNDVWVTSACVAYNGYGFEETFRITQDFAEHFGDNFFLEVQYHDTDSQKQWNKMLLDWSKLLNCKIIMGCDSHYIDSDTAWERTDYLKSKGIEYPQEENWYLDYPDVETAIKRFKIQGVLSDEEIYEAINNTNIFEQVEEYDCPIFNTDIKMPTLYPNLSKKEKNLKLATLVHDNWLKEREKIPKEQWKHYEDEIKRELQTIIDVDHADYFLLYYEGIKHGVELGGVITPSGRGSAVSSYCNKLLGLTKVDRISSIVPLFFERFMSKSRMLEARTLADIDCNITDRDIFIKAFVDLFGEKHCVPMVAFGTMKVKAAWQMYAKSAEIPFEIANAVSKQIEEYETYVKYHSDEDEEPPSVFDFIDEQYHETFQKSRKYLGIISDWKIAPSAVLVYNGDIEEEIGLVRCKENVCCIVDKVWGDDYKFLKLDLLKVSSIQLIYRVFNRLGIKNEDVPDTNELLKLVAQDDKTWEIYSKGYVMGINQVEQEGAMKKIMRYQPHSISDLSSFIAAIRPGFKSMYNIFESRQPFSYNIPSIDNIIQTKESPYSFILYQENIMQILSYAGIPMDNTYEIVKAISKKKKEKILKHKDHFMEGFAKRLIEEEGYTEQSAIDIGNRVWQIIEDSSAYSFNSAHSYSMAFDSLYGAYLKAHYPTEFYEVFLNLLMERGEKDRSIKTKEEAKRAFGIEIVPFKFRQDNRKFSVIDDHSIADCLSNIKGFGNNVAEELYKLKDNQYNTFIDLLDDLTNNTTINKTQIESLIVLHYFDEFGLNKKLYGIWQYYQKVRNSKTIKKDKIKDLGLNEKLVAKYSEKETEKQYSGINGYGLLMDIWNQLPNQCLNLKQQVHFEIEILGYIKSTYKEAPEGWYLVQSMKIYKNPLKPYITLYNLHSGEIISGKINNDNLFSEQPFKEGNVFNAIAFKYQNKMKKINEQWVKTNEQEIVITKYELIG